MINIFLDDNNFVSRNEGRLWATGWQGQMTAYVKYETSNCGACVNDAIYLFYSIFFMSLSRQIFIKVDLLVKVNRLVKNLS